MTTSQIVWIVVIAAAVLILIGLVAASMRKKSHADNHARAGQLRDHADASAAGLPDATARAERAEIEAEHKRLEAQRAEEQAAVAQTDADQQRARHEDEIRAADRLDPEVDHKSKSYDPHVADPAGPATGAAAGTAATTGSTEADGTGTSTTGGGSSVTLEPADTSPRNEATGANEATLPDRLAGEPDEDAGGTHRA